MSNDRKEFNKAIDLTEEIIKEYCAKFNTEYIYAENKNELLKYAISSSVFCIILHSDSNATLKDINTLIATIESMYKEHNYIDTAITTNSIFINIAY